jgi:nitrogen fixation NifU-like protein
MSLYKEILLDHYKNPRHQGELTQNTFVAAEDNPLCGDSVSIYGIVADGKLSQVSFTGKGCVVSQAAASMILEKYYGQSVVDLLNVTSADILNLIQMQLGPNRLKCALLPLVALQKGLQVDNVGSTKTN